MTTRILPPSEWPRIADTGALVDKKWQSLATIGCVVSVEIWTQIIGLAFVFLADDLVPHVDGLWIDADYRGRVSVGRGLMRGVKTALDLLKTDRLIPVPVDAAVWLERRARGIRL